MIDGANRVEDVSICFHDIASSGGNHYVRMGNEKQIDFLLVPGNRLFRRVIKLETGNPEIEVADNVALFKIITKSKLFRFFSDPVFLAYNKQSNQLDYYSGPTNLHGAIKGLEKSKQIAI